MAPIHDTDVGEERWAQAEWLNYELWEKLEMRQRRKKRLWIAATAFCFLGLSSIPIVMERWPKWTTRRIARHLAQEINWVKKEAILAHSAFRLRFLMEKGLSFVVEELADCHSQKPLRIVKSGSLATAMQSTYQWLNPEQGVRLGIPELIDEICYDHLEGITYSDINKNTVGIAIIPDKDLTEKTLERMSILLLTGKSGEMSFD